MVNGFPRAMKAARRAFEPPRPRPTTIAAAARMLAKAPMTHIRGRARPASFGAVDRVASDAASAVGREVAAAVETASVVGSPSLVLERRPAAASGKAGA